MTDDGLDIEVEHPDDKSAPSTTRPEDFSDASTSKAKLKKYAPVIVGAIIILIFAAVTILRKGGSSPTTSSNTATATPDASKSSSTDLTGLETQLSQQYTQTQQQISNLGNEIDKTNQAVTGLGQTVQTGMGQWGNISGTLTDIQNQLNEHNNDGMGSGASAAAQGAVIVKNLNTLQTSINHNYSTMGKSYFGSATQIEQHQQKIANATKLGYQVDSTGGIFDGGGNRVTIPTATPTSTVSALDQLKALQGTIQRTAQQQGKSFNGSADQTYLHDQKVQLATQLGYNVGKDGSLTDSSGKKVTL